MTSSHPFSHAPFIIAGIPPDTTRTDVKAEVIEICERDGKSESHGHLAEERQKRYDLL